MSEETPEEIWWDATKSRFFAVPADVAMVPGEVRLSRLTGAPRDVDPLALRPFSISREEAEARIEQLLAENLSRLQGAFDAAATRGGVPTSRLPSVREILRVPGGREKNARVLPAENPAGKLVTDPEAARAWLLAQVADLPDPDPETAARATEAMRTFRGLVKDVGEVLKEAREKALKKKADQEG